MQSLLPASVRRSSAQSAASVAFVEPIELLSGLRSGHGPSYEELVRRYRRGLLAVARRMLRDTEDARDCVQEAFFLAFRSIGRFEGRSSIWTWLRSIVVNVALMRLRYRRRRPEILLEDVLSRFQVSDRRIEIGDSRQEDAETVLMRREVLRRTRGAIESLPEIYRDVLFLRYVKDLDTREAARTLKISRGAAKVRSHRGRAALRTAIEALDR